MNSDAAKQIPFVITLNEILFANEDNSITHQLCFLAQNADAMANWGGLLGFMIGKEQVEKTFGQKIATKFNIHRTRKGFPNNGIDNFENMALKGISIVDRVVVEKMNGSIDTEKNLWVIPKLN